MGFSNRWYAPAIESRVAFALRESLTIHIPPAPHFLAMKWAAVDGRAKGDLRLSHDMEDIISVIAGRASILKDIEMAPQEVREWLAEKANAFLLHPDAEDAMAGALPDAARIPDLIPMVRERFRKIRDRIYE